MVLRASEEDCHASGLIEAAAFAGTALSRVAQVGWVWGGEQLQRQRRAANLWTRMWWILSLVFIL